MFSCNPLVNVIRTWWIKWKSVLHSVCLWLKASCKTISMWLMLQQISLKRWNKKILLLGYPEKKVVTKPMDLPSRILKTHNTCLHSISWKEPSKQTSVGMGGLVFAHPGFWLSSLAFLLLPLQKINEHEPLASGVWDLKHLLGFLQVKLEALPPPSSFLSAWDFFKTIRGTLGNTSVATTAELMIQISPCYTGLCQVVSALAWSWMHLLYNQDFRGVIKYTVLFFSEKRLQ